MKKALAVLLTIVVLTMCSVSSFHAVDEPRFQTEIVRGEKGDLVDVNLNILNNPGITALSVDVIYSSADLELVSVSNGGLFEDSISTGDTNANPLRISWYASDSQNKTQSGTLAILKYRIRDNAICSRVSISYNPENMVDNNLQNQSFEISNGWVLVGDKKIGDTNSDNNVSIRDVTAIQRQLVELEDLSDEEFVLADTNGDGEINIADATHLQMYLAEYDVQLG
nr:dockerin type I domain-containing protein [uncultured Ruminococcus sp.]